MIFERIAEAYDVLSNRKLKATFDLLGEIGLKDGVPDGRGGRKGGIYTFEASPMAIFKRFFATDNPYEALMVIQDAFEKIGGSGKPELGAQRTYDLPVTLEEIFHGAHKAVTHTRKVQREGGSSQGAQVQDRNCCFLQYYGGVACDFWVGVPPEWS